jgi:hypothetical protein
MGDRPPRFRQEDDRSHGEPRRRSFSEEGESHIPQERSFPRKEFSPSKENDSLKKSEKTDHEAHTDESTESLSLRDASEISEQSGKEGESHTDLNQDQSADSSLSQSNEEVTGNDIDEEGEEEEVDIFSDPPQDLLKVKW